MLQYESPCLLACFHLLYFLTSSFLYCLSLVQGNILRRDDHKTSNELGVKVTWCESGDVPNSDETCVDGSDICSNQGNTEERCRPTSASSFASIGGGTTFLWQDETPGRLVFPNQIVVSGFKV